MLKFKIKEKHYNISMHPQARWQQRFSNFKKSFALTIKVKSLIALEM
ncbi:MAG: hypothetical protein VKK32_06785 [Candidatus Melainabacteria bacterium]|nr:hypothetical protein [Candidatus Melainabacteria bacterium]